MGSSSKFALGRVIALKETTTSCHYSNGSAYFARRPPSFRSASTPQRVTTTTTAAAIILPSLAPGGHPELEPLRAIGLLDNLILLRQKLLLQEGWLDAGQRLRTSETPHGGNARREHTRCQILSNNPPRHDKSTPAVRCHQQLIYVKTSL